MVNQRKLFMNKYILFFLLLVLTPFVYGKTWLVEPIAGKKPLQETINKAQAFDTILVKAGHYKEANIKIKIPLTLMGENLPIIDGELKHEMISILSNCVTINGFKFINSGFSDLEDIAAIKVYEKNYVRIINNVLKDNFFGIYLSNSFYCLVQNNQITGPNREQNHVGNGVHSWKSAHNFILNNIIKNQRDGIYFEFVKHSIIANNFSEGNLRYGLHFMFSDSDSYYNNTFLNNGAGVAVMYSQFIMMVKNKFYKNWGSSSYGILLKDIRDSKLYKNNFDENTVGIFMDGCSRADFINNHFSNNGYALRMQASCDDNNFRFNNFLTNTFDYATNGFTVLNVLKHNYWDKYKGYDLDKNGLGDLSYRPMNMLAGIIEEYPSSIILLQSFLADLLNVLEKILPSLTPENLKDNYPLMKKME